MAVGKPSTAGGCATGAAGRAVRLSAGVRAIVPVTSAFAEGAGPVEGALNKGGLSSADKLATSTEFRSDWTGSPLGAWGAGVKLGSVWGAIRRAVTSLLAVTASLSPFWISLESTVGSGSKLTATLLSGASKIPKWKILLVIWTRPRQWRRCSPPAQPLWLALPTLPAVVRRLSFSKVQSASDCSLDPGLPPGQRAGPPQ